MCVKGLTQIFSSAEHFSYILTIAHNIYVHNHSMLFIPKLHVFSNPVYTVLYKQDLVSLVICICANTIIDQNPL